MSSTWGSHRDLEVEIHVIMSSHMLLSTFYMGCFLWLSKKTVWWLSDPPPGPGAGPPFRWPTSSQVTIRNVGWDGVGKEPICSKDARCPNLILCLGRLGLGEVVGIGLGGSCWCLVSFFFGVFGVSDLKRQPSS